jgi:hypothetical protein
MMQFRAGLCKFQRKIAVKKSTNRIEKFLLLVL